MTACLNLKTGHSPVRCRSLEIAESTEKDKANLFLGLNLKIFPGVLRDFVAL